MKPNINVMCRSNQITVLFVNVVNLASNIVVSFKTMLDLNDKIAHRGRYINKISVSDYSVTPTHYYNIATHLRKSTTTHRFTRK